MLDLIFANFYYLYLPLNYIIKMLLVNILALNFALTYQSSNLKSTLALNLFLVTAIPLSVIFCLLVCFP